ncbi:hypothetical protein O0I10_011658 [Lichtheimia ornata]|uniref:Uncharacterized protein n=1 Tax=Lichtheimia ornata TaxID=688661 RepID=A0AAD7USE3_9FUNG|nr:uncharacterized protein O0I10_011658 [Lichtheimia ornata]KAJ8652713.1 hypothetical protein O0I10_011658 [Lichtheimia ornata]
MATIVNIACSELLKNPIVTAEHGNDGNRIASATETLQETAHQFVQVLNERAMLLANSAQFDTALRDAAAIKTISPESGLGYLCMGDVYCQQGHHAAAISIYDQGLEAVPECDAYYQQLHQHRLTAVANNNKRVDFISRLPFDVVVTNIIPRMQPDFYSESSCKLLYMSRAWQERILQQPKGIRFSFGEETNTFKDGHAQLIRFAPYVQYLGGSLVGVHLDDLFSRASFSNLKELSIFCGPTTPHVPLIHGLKLIADPLTRLTLLECPGLQLRDILETCPNLVYLKTMDVDAVMPLSLSSIYPKMKHLVLYRLQQRARTHENMVDVLSRFPSLRMLKISPMPATTILPILHKHCPDLQAISFECWSPDVAVTTTTVGEGIASAYLGGENVHYRHDLIEFLYEQSNSLEVFHFHGTLEINNALWEISDDGQVQPHTTPLRVANDLSSPLSFTRLVDLRFTNTDPSSGVPMILWIVLNAPNLSAIHLPHSHFQPAVAKAMIKLKYLRKVEVEQNDTTDDIEQIREELLGDLDDDTIDDNTIDNNYDGIHQFFQHHIALGDHSTLQHVVVRVYFVSAYRQTWLPLLSRLRCLKILELCGRNSYTDCFVANNCKHILKRIRRDCPAFERLIINRRISNWLAPSPSSPSSETSSSPSSETSSEPSSSSPSGL